MSYDPLRTQIVNSLMLAGSPDLSAAQIAGQIGKPVGEVYAELRRMRGDWLVAMNRPNPGAEARWSLRIVIEDDSG